MPRRNWMWIALLLSSCRDSAPPIEPFPETVAAVWRRTELRDVPVSESPDPVPRTSVKRLQIAVYEGPGNLEARAYQLTSPAVGVDLSQRWRPSADTVFFAQDRYFLVVRWQQADRKALQDFVREMEQRLKSSR